MTCGAPLLGPLLFGDGSQLVVVWRKKLREAMLMFGRKNSPPPLSIDDDPPGEAEKVLRIKHLCWIAKMSAESYAEMSDEGKRDEFGQHEYKRYREKLSEAINLARELRDTFYRDAALHQLILLLMIAKEEKLAKDLFNVVEVEVIQEAILNDHPRLAAKF
jgi:hypothetical protein